MKTLRDPKIKNKQVREEIAEAMKAIDIPEFNAKECETKFKNLKRTYTGCVYHNKTTGNNPRKCTYCEELQQLFGKDDTVQPIGVGSNSGGILKRRLRDGSAGDGEKTTDTISDWWRNEARREEVNKAEQWVVHFIQEVQSGQARVRGENTQNNEKMGVMSMFLDLFAKTVDEDWEAFTHYKISKHYECFVDRCFIL